MESAVSIDANRSAVRGLATLADEDYQDQVWVKGFFPRDPYLYDFDAACHMLLDDADIMDESDRLIGAILRDEREVGVLRCLGETLLTLIDDISAVGTFEDARRSSKWPPVVAARKGSLEGDWTTP